MSSRVAGLLLDWLTALDEAGLEMPADPNFKDQLLQVMDASDFAAQICLRNPLLILQQAGSMSDVLVPVLELGGVEDEAALWVVLRRFRREQMLRIIWRDICNLADLSETLADLTHLADVCVSQTLARLNDWAIKQSGTPRNAEGEIQQLLVLGMGKLGAGELNLSSDIDLIFVFPEHGETDGKRPLANEQFFTRLGRKLIAALAEQTAEGFVFRVDMRLRPFGEAGPLVVSLGAMENYLHGQAREWERYAMVKARVMTGDARDIQRLQAIIHPFVYRRYIDFGVIESIRDMKRRIAKEMQRKGMDANIKLGRGGIREIEFIGQVFQLIRGGREPSLQTRPILDVLAQLARLQLLPAQVVDELTVAYCFLRLLENRIQAWQDQQTHILPQGQQDRDRLARAMGFESTGEFLGVLEEHQRLTHQHFEQVFAAPEVEPADSGNAWSDVWMAVDDAEVQQQLSAAGYRNAAVAQKLISDFRAVVLRNSLSDKAQMKLDRLMPLLLREMVKNPDPDQTLPRILTLLAAIVRRTAYLDLLLENPSGLTQLVKLAAESSWLTRQLIQQPLLLDEFLDPRRLYSPLGHKQLVRELSVLTATAEIDDLELQMELLRQFNDGNRLRVAAADISGVIEVGLVSDYLSEIAEVVLQGSMDLALRHLQQRHGNPTELDTAGSGFAIIAYGKLGGRELGYSSDLDLVFLHANQNQNAMTDGDRAVANDVFFARLGQRVIHILTTRTPSGKLYEADMRLRPNGKSGMLVSSLVAFERYQMEKAWIWEHQALLRARAVAGDPAVMSRFEEIRRAVLVRERDDQALRSEIVNMREKMRTGLDRTNSRYFDLKQGVGGIADIEFMVQYLALRAAATYPDLLDHTDNVSLLAKAADHGLLSADMVDQLVLAYREFRAVYHRKALQDESGLIGLDELVELRGQVQDCWNYIMLSGKSS